MAHSPAFSPSAFPGSLSFPPFSVHQSVLFFWECVRSCSVRLFASYASQVSSGGCGCLHVRSLSVFRFEVLAGLWSLPCASSALLVSVRFGFPGGPFIFLLQFLFGSLPSNRFTDFEEFGPRGGGPLSASLALEKCPMCGMVTFIEMTVLSGRSALTGAASQGVGGVHLQSRRLRACLSSSVFEPALAAFSLCCSPIMLQVRLITCIFRVVQHLGSGGCPKRNMLTGQGRGCFQFSAGSPCC